ncbi:MAG: YpmP family protein [Bacillaceae bacterium]|nr:YpmP family protein [Bacillaceae bacterium]
MLWKSLEFTNEVGQKVKVIEIPVLEDDSTYHFMMNWRLQQFLIKVNTDSKPKPHYSFREYLKEVLKWPDYCSIFKEDVLKNNA